MSVSVTRNWMNALETISAIVRQQRLNDVRDDVRVQTTPWDGSDVRPGCYVTPTDVRHGKSTNCRNDKGYGCLITVVRGESGSRGATPERTAGWEEILHRLFHDKRLDGLPMATGHARLPCKVETPIDNQDADIKVREQQMEAVSLVVRVWFRETRT
jgi:hypothetical protein